jgi:hypothetical protein
MPLGELHVFILVPAVLPLNNILWDSLSPFSHESRTNDAHPEARRSGF